MSAVSESHHAGEEWKDVFVSMLPRIESCLAREFWGLDPDAREEAIQEGIANCFARYERLARQGRTEVASAISLAKYAARQVRSGRKVGGKLNVRDPLSRHAQISKGMKVERLDVRCRETNDWLQPLVEDRRTSVLDQVALRMDVPVWLSGFARRTRRIARDLALGFSPGDVAKKYRLSPARISQIRRELYESWMKMQEPEACTATA